MQLVLVAGFKASAGKVGPKIKLFEGKWRLCTEHLKDSVLVLRCTDGVDLPIGNGAYYQSDGNGTVEVVVKKAGTEPFINIFAEYINGSDTPKST